VQAVAKGLTSKYSINIKGKVKVKIALEQAVKVQRGCAGIALLFL
jgi:hypothetical protein